MRRIVLFVEGDDDRALLDALADARLLPTELQISRQQAAGWANLYADVATFVRARDGASGLAIALRDVDSPEEEQSHVDQFLRLLDGPKPIPEPGNGRVRAWEVAGGGRAALVLVGLEGDDALAALGVRRYAGDDYVLRLVLDEPVYGGIPEQAAVPHALAKAKLETLARELCDNGIGVDTSKRLLHLLRAITGFRASPATFAQRVLGAARGVLDSEAMAASLSPLLGDIACAARLLRPS
ncbi:MAG: hypothetical protein HY744_25450 [Deltaproteobacteria bacterium]|nr:hypothetical protein [Deltaproteobacteria bacterium]